MGAAVRDVLSAVFAEVNAQGGRKRRTGVLGASLVHMDPASGDAVRVSGWIDVVP